MRATGLGFKSPKDRSGELVHPRRTNAGTILDMGLKSISDQRRELLWAHKLQNDPKATATSTLQASDRVGEQQANSYKGVTGENSQIAEKRL